jgi:hypothetical protein
MCKSAAALLRLRTPRFQLHGLFANHIYHGDKLQCRRRLRSWTIQTVIYSHRLAHFKIRVETLGRRAHLLLARPNPMLRKGF